MKSKVFEVLLRAKEKNKVGMEDREWGWLDFR